jgi:hypothetical protein
MAKWSLSQNLDSVLCNEMAPVGKQLSCAMTNAPANVVDLRFLNMYFVKATHKYAFQILYYTSWFSKPNQTSRQMRRRTSSSYDIVQATPSYDYAFKSCTNKVHIYKEYHSVCPLVGIGTLQTISKHPNQTSGPKWPRAGSRKDSLPIGSQLIFVKKRYGTDQWAATPLQQVANQWVAWGGTRRFHPSQFKTTFHLPSIMECRLCFSAQPEKILSALKYWGLEGFIITRWWQF